LARKPRIEKNGFYHIVNLGVARSNVYCDDKDFSKFLEILEDASLEYDFKVYSFCLMNNHYHLLMEISKENLSVIMQKVNSRYSIYFNNKYKRVGPLWQGRFKNYFVYNKKYLYSLIKYIERNPIKANITNKIGEYRWAMSSKIFEFSMLNYELIKNIAFTKELNEDDIQKLEELQKAKYTKVNSRVKRVRQKNLQDYFSDKNISKSKRNELIWLAVKNGYKQSEVAEFLKLSRTVISKVVNFSE